MRMLELHIRAAFPVTRHPRFATAGDRGHVAGLGRHLSNHMVSRVGDPQVSALVGANLMRPVESRIHRGASITAITFGSLIPLRN